MWGRPGAARAEKLPGGEQRYGSPGSSQFPHLVLTIFASAQPSSNCYGDMKLLSFSKWEEFKLFYGSHTLLHLVSYTQQGKITSLRNRTARTDFANSRSS